MINAFNFAPFVVKVITIRTNYFPLELHGDKCGQHLQFCCYLLSICLNCLAPIFFIYLYQKFNFTLHFFLSQYHFFNYIFFLLVDKYAHLNNYFTEHIGFFFPQKSIIHIYITINFVISDSIMCLHVKRLKSFCKNYE